MKVNLIVACFVILLSSCSKSDDNTPTEKTYSNTNGTSIAITGPVWFASVGYNYYNQATDVICIISAGVALKGTTNGDSIKIKSIQNKVTVYEKMSLYADKSFVQNYKISESTVPQANIPAGEFTKDIEVIVYKGTDSLKVAFNSGPLRYK